MSGGRFEFDDGGIYCGEWLDGKAHSYGICTGPNNEGRFEGFWQNGFELSGTYSWSNQHTYNGEWSNGKINGLGVEDCPSWTYFGEWKNGKRHGSGVLINKKTKSRYEGTWMHGLQEGYGGEIAVNGAYYFGQWKKGLRHGYGIKISAIAAKSSRSSQWLNFMQPATCQSASSKGNVIQQPSFRVPPFLQASLSQETYVTDPTLSQNPRQKRAYFSQHRKKNHLRSEGSKSAGSRSDSNEISDTFDNDFSPGRFYSHQRKSPVGQDSVRTDMASHSSGFGTMSESSSTNSLNINTNSSTQGEMYKGQWILDRRSTYGICEYIDGSSYIGSWKDDARNGYGKVTHGDNESSGKWANDELLDILPKKGIKIRSPRMRTKVQMSHDAATEAGKLAIEKYKTALSRSVTARKIAGSAKIASDGAIEHGSVARSRAEQFDVKFPEPHIDLMMSPRDRFMGEPTLLAFEISKDLPPRHDISEFGGNNESPSNSAHPAKLAGLFAALDLTLSTGAVSPKIYHALHSRNQKIGSKQLRKPRPFSGSAQDAWSKLSSSVSTFRPGIVGASILLPGFPNIPSLDSKVKDPEPEPYYYSSARELELKNRALDDSVSAATDSTATSKSTLVNNICKTDCPSTNMCQHSRSLSQTSRTISDLSSQTSQHSSACFNGSSIVSQSSTSSSVVKISGVTAMGEQIKLGYMQATATIDGNDKPIYCTKAPRPRLSHHSSISESKSVSAATGLYRTIVGELPAALSLHNEIDSEEDRSKGNFMTESEKEAEIEAMADSLSDNVPNHVFEIESSPEEVVVDSILKEQLRRRSLEKLRKENDADVNLEESNRQFINHSRTHPSVFRTSSKIRRQKPIDDSDVELMDNDKNGNNSHDTVRKTKSDISNVRVMNNRRIQIPVRSAKSFDNHTQDDDDSVVSDSRDDTRKGVIVCVRSVQLNCPTPIKLISEATDDFLNNNISDLSEKENLGGSEVCHHEDSKHDNSAPSSSSLSSRYCGADVSLNRQQEQQRYLFGNIVEVDLHDTSEECQIRRRKLSQSPQLKLKTWV